MAPKRLSPLDEPPAATTSDEEEATSGEEEEEVSGSESGSEEEEDEPESEQKQQQPKISTLTPNHASDKKSPSKKPDPAASNDSKPQSSGSGSETDSDETGSDSEPENNRRIVGADPNVKPIASKPMEETPPAKKPRSKSNTTPTRLPAKRPSESEAKDSKRAKKKGPERDEEDEPGTAAEDETKKTGDDSKTKLFQRLWSEDDEIVILKGIVDYTAKKGTDPSADMNAFHDFIKKSLHVNVTKSQLVDKVRRLKKKYENNSGKGKKFNPTKAHEQKAFDLSKKIWGEEQPSGGVEQPKSNGKAKSSQKSNSRSLALLKAELLSSPEASKEVVKMDVDRNTGVSEMVSFDKTFGLVGLPEHVLKQGLDLIAESKRAELEEKWKKLHLAELELYTKRTQLISDQAKLILDAYKSSDH